MMKVKLPASPVIINSTTENEAVLVWHGIRKPEIAPLIAKFFKQGIKPDPESNDIAS